MESHQHVPPKSLWGILGALWGVAGVSALLIWAIYRLSYVAAEAFTHSLNAIHWVFLIGFLLLMLYSEGWRGFYRAFSPRTAARARYIMFHPNRWRVLLAPLFCMCFFGATRKRMIVAYVLNFSILFLVICIRFVPQPWRGLVDAGVVAGLGAGILSLLYFCLRALLSKEYNHRPDVTVPVVYSDRS